MKKITVLLCLTLLLLVGCGTTNSSNNTDKTKEYESKIADISTQLDKKSKELTDVQTKYNELKEELTAVNAEFNQYKEKMKPFEALSEQEAKKKLEEAKKEEEAKKAAEEAEKKKGYESGITYEQIARTPDDYEDKLVKFTGTVVQVLEADGEAEIRLAINDDYDKIVYLFIPAGILNERVLENDTITIYGVSKNTITYQSTLGGDITIPAILVDKLDIKK